MTISLYVLRDRVPVLIADQEKWQREFYRSNRVIALTKLGAFHVATTFVGMGRREGELPPLLFETMIVAYGDRVLNGWVRRNATIEEAEACHAEAVTLVKERMGRA